MHKQYDESELLELIEGRLEPAKATALEARLAGDAAARMKVDRMRADRTAMRSLPEPELPMDFLAQSEHLLARPMLMEPIGDGAISRKPGAYRRQQQKLRWRVRWPRLAVAAVVLLAGGAGLWQLGVTLWPAGGVGAGDGALIASNEDERAAGEELIATNVVDVRELTGVIHHALPSERTIALALAARDAMNVSAETMTASTAGVTVNAEFALVIRSKDFGSAEAAISKAVTDASAPSALVRNFNFEEARRLDREWRMAHMGARDVPQPSAVADVRGTSGTQPKLQLRELADHVRRQLQSTPAAESKEPTSGCVAGAKELSPTLEQQLELSSRGATHVLVIRADQLQEALHDLGMDATHTTSLRMLPEAPAISEAVATSNALPVMPALEAWLEEGPRVREAMRAVAQQSPQTMVRVPVVIEALVAKR